MLGDTEGLCGTTLAWLTSGEGMPSICSKASSIDVINLFKSHLHVPHFSVRWLLQLQLVEFAEVEQLFYHFLPFPHRPELLLGPGNLVQRSPRIDVDVEEAAGFSQLQTGARTIGHLQRKNLSEHLLYGRLEVEFFVATIVLQLLEQCLFIVFVIVSSTPGAGDRIFKRNWRICYCGVRQLALDGAASSAAAPSRAPTAASKIEHSA